MTGADLRRGKGPREASGGPLRLDIQGLRAVAVLLVLVYHLWPGGLTGGFIGVDVFFVISGFLITGHLLQHPPRRSRDLLEFWGRRIRRLLPAAFLVLAVTAVASRLVAPETRWGANAGEIIASALYVENWVLAGNAVDYLGAAEAASPVQHYWSLSVEEQFYILWPILLLAVFWLARRTRIGASPVTRAAMVAVIGISLYSSITATAEEPAGAYFITQTRIWELAVGGFVATLPPLIAIRPAARLADPAAWIGLVVMVVAGVAFSAATPFPGYAALLPVLGTALFILAGTEGRRSPTRFLRLRPIQHIGDTSYSIYLWHWPLLALWPYAFGEITLVASLVILGATLVLATITKVLVEDPFRFARSFQPLVPTFRFAAAGMIVLTVVGGAQLLEAQVRLDAALAAAPDSAFVSDEEPPDVQPPDEASPVPTSEEGSSAPPDASPRATRTPAATEEPEPTAGNSSCYGAASIVRGFEACPQDQASKLVPEPVVARTDRSDAYRDGCWIYAPFGALRTCEYGHGDVRIALVGNSHAGQWLPTLQRLAKKHGWTITTFLASQCNATDARLEFLSDPKTEGCLAYGRWVMDQTRGGAFDLVITTERQSVRTQGDTWGTTAPTALAGYKTYLQRWSDAGTNVLILRDTPFPGRTLWSVPDCLALHPSDHSKCAGTPESWRSMDPLFDAAQELQLPGISAMETQRFLCTATECPAVIGTVVAYFDASHMTATYARSVAPFVEADIVAALQRAR
jgi:peptidoglycan/LPS O-acetylase OafA/YrhL